MYEKTNEYKSQFNSDERMCLGPWNEIMGRRFIQKSRIQKTVLSLSLTPTIMLAFRNNGWFSCRTLLRIVRDVILGII